MTKEALKLALEALEFYYDMHEEEADAKAITAIKEALAQPEQEPVAWMCAALIAALEAKDEPVNDELRRLHDLLGKANALARIRAAEIESMKASLYGLYELEKQRDELEQRLTKTEAQLGEAVWNYGELKREQLANQQNTSGSPIFSELHCICGAEWEWRNRDWELVTTPPQRKPLTVEQAHSEFEAWHKNAYTQSLEPYGHTYKNHHTRCRWQGWLAAHGIKGEA